MTSTEDRAVSEMSQRLLQGWTMLAESCPHGCNVPLLEKRSSQTIYCTACQRKFRRNPNTSHMETLTEPTPTTNTTEPSTIQLPPRTESSPIPIANGTPKPKANGIHHSPTPNNSFGSQLQELSESQQRDLDRRRNISNILGQRLLQGWAMLDSNCPDCNAPIMRDRDQQMWCVSCDKRVQTLPTSNNPSAHPSPRVARRVSSNSQPVSTPQQTPQPTPQLTQQQQPSHLEQFPPFDQRKHDLEDRDADLSLDDESEEETNLTRQPRMKQQQTRAQRPVETPKPQTTTTTQTSRTSPIQDNETNAAVLSAKNALLKKLAEYTKILETSYDFEQQKRMCELIGAAASSLDKLGKLSISKQ